MKVELVPTLEDAGKKKHFKVCIDDDMVAKVTRKSVVNIKIEICDDRRKTVTCHWAMSDMAVMNEVFNLLCMKI